jgi:twitching motility protein PilT
VNTIAIDPTNETKVLAALRQNPLFASLSDDHVRQAAERATLVVLEVGEALVSRGAVPDGFFIMLEGELTVLLPSGSPSNPLEVARVGAGHTVGVASLLLDQPSPVTMQAAIPATVIRFSPNIFRSLAHKVPSFGLEVARSLAERLATAVERIPIPEADPSVHPSEDLLHLLPLEFIKRHRLLPLASDGSTLTIGFVDDPSPETIQRIRALLPSMEIRAVHIEAARLAEVLTTHVSDDSALASEDPPDTASLEQALRAMVSEGASDLHLSAGQQPHWRIDGRIRAIQDVPPLGPETVLELLGPHLPERNRREFEERNDTDFAHSIPGLARFRVNLFRDTGGVGAVFRQIPMKTLSLEQLAMPEVVGRFCALPKGLVLVTGPTGSGKSTTLAAMVDLINSTREEHIITLEDPVEFVHQSRQSLINQREVGSHTASFSRALRAALREDPDVVLVGEMRDLETISLALETANTGHLVLATLHTATAVSTIDRIVGMFPSDEQSRIRSTLADVLCGVVSQNLLQKIGGGRVAALEILVVNHAVANLIRERKTHQIVSSMQTGQAAGNRLLNDSLAALVKSGKVEADEALSKAIEKDDLMRRLKGP